MEELTSFTTKTGPIHLPKDGRPVDVQVLNLVKTFGKIEAVKGVSFTIGRGEIFGLLERRSRNGKDEVDRTSWGWLAQEK